MTREEIIKWLKSLKTEIGKSEHRTLWHYAEAIDVTIEALSADRLSGEWVDKGEYAECSICGTHGWTQFDGIEPILLKAKFCPNCGAKMIGNEKKKENNNVHKAPLYAYASWDRSEE